MVTRILLADDEAAITSELAPLLRCAGFDVSVAEDGHAALRLAGQLQPDCIVLGVLMPGCDGREVCRRLRASGDSTLTQFGASGERAMALTQDRRNSPAVVGREFKTELLLEVDGTPSASPCA